MQKKDTTNSQDELEPLNRSKGSEIVEKAALVHHMERAAQDLLPRVELSLSLWR